MVDHFHFGGQEMIDWLWGMRYWRKILRLESIENFNLYIQCLYLCSEIFNSKHVPTLSWLTVAFFRVFVWILRLSTVTNTWKKPENGWNFVKMTTKMSIVVCVKCSCCLNTQLVCSAFIFCAQIRIPATEMISLLYR